MKSKIKVWVARDQCGDLRVHTNKPMWIPQVDNNGFFLSEGRDWQCNDPQFDFIVKGDKKSVWLTYELSIY